MIYQGMGGRVVTCEYANSSPVIENRTSPVVIVRY